jgi:hypothetical protein
MKLEQGKKYPPLPNLSWVIVDLVKSIQQMHYPKRPYRHRGEWNYVEEVAARYLGVSVENLRKNPLLRRKKTTRAK